MGAYPASIGKLRVSDNPIPSPARNTIDDHLRLLDKMSMAGVFYGISSCSRQIPTTIFLVASDHDTSSG
jgi:hypothetical protein